MTELQSRLLEILKWYDGFCREHKLTYYAVGGTLLGAVRHKGFIPWDDDIDVGMPREDYEKFLRMVKRERHPYFLIESPFDCQLDYPYPFAKIFDSRTTLIEDTKLALKRGIYIDVFPIDGAGKNRFIEYVKYLSVRFLFYLLVTRSSKLDKKRNIIKKICIKISNSLNYIIPNLSIIRMMNKIYSIEDYNKSDKIGNLCWGYGLKEHIHKENWGIPIEYNFEDIKILGHRNYDGYLKNLFGDYMTPPAKDKQNFCHKFIVLDLKNSYLNIDSHGGRQ